MIDPFSFTHHATLILDEQRKELSEHLWSLVHTHSLHHINFTTTVLDIDTARRIQEWNISPHDETQERKAILCFHSITIPAQNALLKVLEEPSSGTSFILITSSSHSLLPTFLSRMNILKTSFKKDQGVSNELQDIASLFFITKKTERTGLPIIKKLLQTTDEKDRKDREGFRTFIMSLIEYKNPLITAKHREELLIVASYSTDTSSSLKALLEYISLLLPCTKI